MEKKTIIWIAIIAAIIIIGLVYAFSGNKILGSPVCTDTDGGGVGQENIAGIVYYKTSKFSDVCSGTTSVKEYSCTNTSYKYATIKCASGKTCQKGACTRLTQNCTDTCASLGKQCGVQTICSQATYCGNCTSGKICTNGICTSSCTDTCASLGKQCGNQVVCGVSTNCGSCSAGRVCTNGVCANQTINSS